METETGIVDGRRRYLYIAMDHVIPIDDDNGGDEKQRGELADKDVRHPCRVVSLVKIVECEIE